MAHSVEDTAFIANHFAHAVNCSDFTISPKKTEPRITACGKGTHMSTPLLGQSCPSQGWVGFLLPREQTNTDVMKLLSVWPQLAVAAEGCPATCGNRSGGTTRAGQVSHSICTPSVHGVSI